MIKITDYLSLEDEKEIVEAIKKGEKQTSGEIRLHIEMNCPIDKPFDRALQVFEQLEMHKTDLQNGILIYVALKDHKLVVCGDKGINDILGQKYWEDTVTMMTGYFKNNQYKKGLIEGVTEIGQKLKQHFPFQSNDTNELSDDISKG